MPKQSGHCDRRSGKRHGVTVNTICPSPVQEITDLDTAIELCDHDDAWHSRNKITPQDIAEGVVMLCSEDGRFITGCALPYAFTQHE